MEGICDARPANSKQKGKELVGDGQSIGAEAVVPHQEPAGEPHVESAATVGERGVAALHHKDVNVAQKRGRPRASEGRSR